VSVTLFYEEEVSALGAGMRLVGSGGVSGRESGGKD
jgi:hypothetical protein